MPPYARPRPNDDSSPAWLLGPTDEEDIAQLAATATVRDDTPTLVGRQNNEPATVTVIQTDAEDNSGDGGTTLSAGAIAGIVIGSIAGFLLVLWLVRSCMNLGAPPAERESWYRGVDPDEKRRRHSSRHAHRSRSRHHRSSSARRRSTSLPAPPQVVVVDDGGYHQSHRHHARRSSRGATAYYAPREASRGRRPSADY